MEFTKGEWNGYERLDLSLDGRDTIVILPKEREKDNRWLLKTEYFGAFPEFELDMLSRGWAVAHIKNKTRWCLPEDTDAKEALCAFMEGELGFASKCLPVGMSCGGMQAVYFAAKYPHRVSALYLDAPVLNLLSCPCGVGVNRGHVDHLYAEFVTMTGRTVTDLINYREHPIDFVRSLIASGIPAYLVCGGADMTVPYEENGALLAKWYKESDVPFFETVKPACGHHPHGLADRAPLIAFAERYG